MFFRPPPNRRTGQPAATSWLLSTVVLLLIAINTHAQSPTIPGTGTSAATCGTCAPVGWNNTGGTPDISDRNRAGGQGTLGAEASWIINGSIGQLPLPPNGDVRWITMRDVGDFNTQVPENVTTQIDGLIIGNLYKITYFVMSAFSAEDGGTGNNQFYGGSYMDNFDYQLSNVNNGGSYPPVNVVITQDYEEQWVTASIIFVASDTSMDFTVFPGDDAVTGALGPEAFEILHFAVDDVNAIERIDTDGDGIFDDVDIDDDNDGILDTEEYGFGPSPSADADSDGIPNYLDTDFGGPDSNLDGIPDAFDFDGDGIPNHLDLDSDNDGILDIVEAQPSGSFVSPTGLDDDNDGLDNAFDLTPSGGPGSSGGISPLNTDGQQDPDYLDIDADDDGIPDNVEAQPTLTYIPPSGVVGANGVLSIYETADNFTPVALTPVNTDNADEPDYRDTDSDNDGLTDIEENNEGNTPGTADTDGDGLLNNFDDDNTNYDVNDDINDPDVDLPDTDGDVNTGGDVDYRDGVNGTDTDGDGVPDSVDIDDDNDGILDVNEGGCETIPTASTGPVVNSSGTSAGDLPLINDGDFTANNGIRLNRPGEYIVVDLESLIPAGVTVQITLWDSDGADDRNKLMQFTQLTDPNVVTGGTNLQSIGEANIASGGSVTTFDYVLDAPTRYVLMELDTRTQGRIEVVEAQILEYTPCTTVDTDGDGIFDYLDIDSDNDGIPDNYEAQANGAFVPRLGVDTDGDGLDDNYDQTPNGDPDGTGSIGLSPVNTDGTFTNSDTIPDYLDIDADNDGIPDNIEAQTTTGYMAPNGVPGANGLDSAYDFTDGFTVTGLSSSLVDFDNDSTPDFRDTNSDGDGFDDVDEGLTGLGAADFSGTDTDGDGLDDAFEGADNNDGFDVNDEINDPSVDRLIDADGDVNSSGDVDYRDTLTGTDTDGDGIVDSIDIDDDDDGILDVDECPPLIGETTFTTSNGTDVVATITEPIENFVLDITQLDNSFTLAVNGTLISTSALEFQTNQTVTVEFADGDAYGVGGIPEIWALGTSNPETPILRLIVDDLGQASLFGSKTLNGPLFPMVLIGGNTFNTVSFNNTAPNNFTVDQPVIGPTTISGRIYGTFGDCDFDGDGIINSLDLDSDNDGILDIVESQPSGAFVAPTGSDQDNDGLDDAYDDTPTGGEAGSNGTSPVNTDTLGNPDYLDIDADDDGIPDNVEGQSTVGYISPTGIVGNNGVDSAYELNDTYQATALTPINTDTAINNNADAIPDYRDTDSDGDGLLDEVESGITANGGGTADADGDGLLDTWEGSDATAGEAYDVNDEINDPVNDLLDADGDGNSTGDVDYRDIDSNIDTDDDGVSDADDIDDDNDGLLDINEGFGANNPIGDEDGDGLLNFEDTTDDGNSGDGSTTDYTDTNADGIPDVFDTDNDGIPNHLDIDADNDGIPDNIEIQPTIGYIGPSGTGSGITDADGDGLDDNYDANTSNIDPIASVGVATPTNTDGTDDPDYLDSDSDNDGTPDIQENGKPSTVSGTDSDGDGLDDNFEGISVIDGFDVNDEDNNPATDLPDEDGDVNTEDVDYRDDDDDRTPPSFTGNVLWLRADIDLTVTGGTSDVIQWDDQSGNNFIATSPGADPQRNLTGLNFNPTVEFTETSSHYMQITNGILGNATYTDVWIYAVAESNSATNDTYLIDHDMAATDIEVEVPDGGGSDFRFQNGTGTALDGTDWGGTANVFNIWTAGSSSSQVTPSGNNKAVYRDGLLIDDNNTGGSATFTANDGDLWIGSNNGTGTYMDGSIAEILVYTDVPSAARQQQLESYLAVKYGITLSNFGGNAGVNAGDYVLQDLTTTVWDEDANSAYHNDVAGIGRDDGMLLNQKQSKSINSDAIITIGLGSIVDSNANNGNAINSNKSFLMWGNNNAPVNNLNTTQRSLLCEDELQLDRVWKVVETGSIGTVEVAATQSIIDAALTTPSSEIIVAKIADDANFTVNVHFKPVSVRDVNGVDHYVFNYDFNGTKYFTYTEVLGIFWNGDDNAWTGGSRGNQAPATDDINGAIDGLKVLVIDAETSGTNAIMTASANVECVWVQPNSKLIIGSDLFLEFNEDFLLEGEIRMINDAQLVQTHAGLSNVQGNGKIYRDQAALVPSIYRYHYWSSPVTAALGNTTYTVDAVMKDGTTPTSENSVPKDINWIDYDFTNVSTLNGAPTDPITLSTWWIYSFFNGITRDDWVQNNEDGAINIAEGFIMKSTGRSPQNFTFVGSPNDGTYTKTLTPGTTSLLGNPYPSVINTNQFLADNTNVIDGTLYYWEHQGESSTTTTVEGHYEFGYVGGYSQRNQAMGVAANSVVEETAGLGEGTYTAPEQFVPVAQSFFVSVPSNKGGVLRFENSQRDASLNNVFLRSENKEEDQENIPNLKIGMDYTTDTNAKIHRQLGLNFKAGNTFDYESGFDSGIFDLQSTDMFWDLQGINGNLIIAGVGELSTDLQVPLGFAIDSDDPVYVMLDETENMDSSIEVYLVDLVTGRFYNLENPVQLTLPKGNYTGRFILTFGGSALSTDNPLLKGIQTFVDNVAKDIVVRNKNNTPLEAIEVYNMTGQKVAQWKNPENIFENRFNVGQLASGIYIVRIATEKGVKIQKILIE